MAPKSRRRGRSIEPEHRGRPVGSIKLAADAEANILTYIEAGAADYIAAEIAGIDARTFRDYVQRGLGLHPTRACTPRLARFAKAVMQAKARARAAREIEAADHHVTFWLTHMARSKPDREGWTEPVGSDEDGPAPPLYQPSMEEAAETLRVLLEAGVLSQGEASGRLPPSDEVAEANGG
jgi:hypothetical protein